MSVRSDGTRKDLTIREESHTGVNGRCINQSVTGNGLRIDNWKNENDKRGCCHGGFGASENMN